MKVMKKLVAFILVWVLAFSFVGCAGGSGGADSASSGSEASPSASSANASGSSASELFGSPWVTSVVTDNLPSEVPAATDDLYTHYAYNYIAEHQGVNSMILQDSNNELRETITPVIKDNSKTSHELEQLRIFYNQAADYETLQQIGLSEVQPYLDRIDAVTSIEEMSALLASDDFPFNPFVASFVTVSDTRANNIVGIQPEFVLFDLLTGASYYQDSDDERVSAAREQTVMLTAAVPMLDLMVAGMDQDEAYEAALSIAQFEKSYGRYVPTNGTFLQEDFGAGADAAREGLYSLDDLCALCPGFPLREMLTKYGKAGSEKYRADHEWLEVLNGLWNNDNLEVIKLAAKAKVLGETRPFRDPSAMNALVAALGQEPTGADEYAYAACDKMDTFSQVLAKIYVNDVLGPETKTRLETLAQDLIDEYKVMVNDTAWLSDDSKKRVTEKLDHITLNVLEPQGGYFDYSGLELTPTEEDGTLFSNYLKLKQYRHDYESKMIGQPAGASSVWFAVEPTMMNAFYDVESNSINIVPGFVTSLTCGDGKDDEVLFSGTGWTIAHEISHGFDYLGAQFDAYGRPDCVLADADVDSFVLKCTTLARYYDGIQMTNVMNVDGQNVVAEAAADLCGMQALLGVAAKIDGFDYEEFYEHYATTWARVITREMFPAYAVDVHPLNNLRINVTAQMFQEFYDAFGVKEGDTMYLAPDERIAIWGANA